MQHNRRPQTLYSNAQCTVHNPPFLSFLLLLPLLLRVTAGAQVNPQRLTKTGYSNPTSCTDQLDNPQQPQAP